jgi:hypothetical protein
VRGAGGRGGGASGTCLGKREIRYESYNKLVKGLADSIYI